MKVKVYRFMSLKEFDLMSAGVPMVHRNSFRHNRTNSEGFCFLPETVKGTFIDYEVEEDYSVEYTPAEFFAFLDGIVSPDVLVEFEVDSENLVESYGVYSGYSWNSYTHIMEYCAKTYDRDSFVPLRYAVSNSRYPRNDEDFTWYTFN